MISSFVKSLTAIFRLLVDQEELAHLRLIKGIVMQIEKALTNDRLCFKNMLKISHWNYLWFCSNLTVKFAIFSKSSLRFNCFHCIFCLLTKLYGSTTKKTRTVINAKISVFVIFVEAITHYYNYNGRWHKNVGWSPRDTS